MAFITTPLFSPAYQTLPFGLCAPASRPACSYRVARPQPRRLAYSPFIHFFSQVDDLLNELDRGTYHQARLEAQRNEVRRQQQQRKRVLRALFTVSETEQGWQIDGEMEGFEQNNLSIEISDQHTLKVAGDTKWRAEEQQPATERFQENQIVGAILSEPDFETITSTDSKVDRINTPGSDSESYKSRQATVEDDFEDLGAETSSLISTSAETEEGKGKVQDVVQNQTETVSQAPLDQIAAKQSENQSPEERVHGSFERTFEFPVRIDTTSISASFQDGVLRISVPKAQAQQARRIVIM